MAWNLRISRPRVTPAILALAMVLAACDGPETDVCAGEACDGPETDACTAERSCGRMVAPSLVGRGLSRSVLIDGDLLYGVGPAGLEVFDLSLSPDPVGTLAPGLEDVSWLDVAGGGGTLFIVTERADGPEGSRRLRIVDVTTPSAPALVDALDLQSGNWIHASGTTVLVTDLMEAHVIATDGGAELRATFPLPTAPSRVDDILPRGDTLFVNFVNAPISEVVAMDISDPASPQQIGRVSAGPASLSAGRGKLMALDSDHLLVLRSAIYASVVSVADPAAMAVVATLEIEAVVSAYDAVQAAEADVGYFIIQNGVGAIDARAPSAPVFSMIDAGSEEWTGPYRGIAVQDGIVSVVNGSGVERFDFTDFASPFRLPTADATLARQPSASARAVSGSTVYVADGPRGIRSFEVCGTEPPTEVASRLESASALLVQSRGNLLAVVDGSGEAVRLYEIADERESRSLGTVPLSSHGPTYAFFALAESAVVTTLGSELRIHPIGPDAVAATPASRIALPWGSFGQVVAAGDVIIAAGVTPGGLELARIDLADLTLTVSTHPAPEGELRLRSTNDLVTISDNTGTWLLDADHIEQPVLTGRPWVPASGAVPFPDGSRAIDALLRIWDPADITTFVRDLPGEGEVAGFTPDGHVIVDDELFRVVDPSCP